MSWTSEQLEQVRGGTWQDLEATEQITEWEKAYQTISIDAPAPTLRLLTGLFNDGTGSPIKRPLAAFPYHFLPRINAQHSLSAHQ